MFELALPLPPFFPALNVDVSLRILRHLDVDDLSVVGRTGAVGKLYAAVTISRRARKALKPFIVDPPPFLHELHNTCSVIGGLSALHILYPWMPSATTLTIYAPRATWFHVAGYLVACEGYTPTIKVCDARFETSGLAILRMKRGMYQAMWA